MSDIKMKEVRIVDEDHVWIDGEQFISLRRLNKLRYDTSAELANYEKEVKRLTDQNNAYKILLGNELNA